MMNSEEVGIKIKKVRVLVAYVPLAFVGKILLFLFALSHKIAALCVGVEGILDFYKE